MSKHARDRRPYIKPVTRIELSGKNMTLRLILIVVLLAVASVAIMIAVGSALNVEPGWQEVEIDSDTVNCSADFVLMYDFSEYGGKATGSYKQLIEIYSRGAEDAFAIFTASDFETDRLNVRYLNDHINETVAVEPALYRALSLIAEYDSRYPFLAPVYEEYDRIFVSDNDPDAARFDPARNPEQLEYVQKVAAFVNDPDTVSLEILGEGKVCLHVSDEYLAFARDYELDTFFDLHWMTNGFIIDYLAEVLVENDYTSGYLASYDGFTRNLDRRGMEYSYNIYDLLGSEICLPGVLNYSKPISIVNLKGYPMSEKDKWHYYGFADGAIVSTYLDIADGMSKSATDNLLSYSYELGCAEILLQTAPLFISDVWDSGSVNALTDGGIYSIWCDEEKLVCNDANAALKPMKDNGGDQYTIQIG